MRHVLIIFLLTVLFSEQCLAQNELEGLWEIESVIVGDQDLTPVARWTRIHPNGTLETGNGWLQHASGTYTYNADSGTFKPDNPLGMEDPAGPFIVSFEGDKMIWTRMEEGMNVRVVAARRDELPMAPADLLGGQWGLTDVRYEGTVGNQSRVPEDWTSVYFGWDRIYRAWNTDGQRITGYWHMHADRPELVILPHAENSEPVSWSVKVNKSTLSLTGISPSVKDLELTFERLRSRTE